MTTLLFGIGFIGIFFALMCVRLIFLKDGEFKGTCASQNPYLNKEGTTCGFCGKSVTPGDGCGNPESEVNKVIEQYK
ncbi:hypothetical protein E1176_19830 [Fulvivirga sp. RKSG066]|uniref:hypothetical protein n=1 Tax=Fulvivirga aurantia TaxID=2529383 RepID=UPI0012BC46FD|nr:hypothetical protein [Fulvivirga aurantia]MTI23289.1 hypothetical protein [Fulvivirga aurantia]